MSETLIDPWTLARSAAGRPVRRCQGSTGGHPVDGLFCARGHGAKASLRMCVDSRMSSALDYVARDYITAFDRARAYLNDIIGDYTKEKRVELINMVWQSNNLKGYVTEMEATAMLKLAKDWNVEKELVELVLK